jgi:hypothetical protein
MFFYNIYFCVTLLYIQQGPLKAVEMVYKYKVYNLLLNLTYKNAIKSLKTVNCLPHFL